MKEMKTSTKDWIGLLILCFSAAIFVISADTVKASSGTALDADVSLNQTWSAGKWVYVDGKGYYKKDNGIVSRGWLHWKNHIYYLTKSSGAKAVGFHTIDGKRYYFRENSGRLKMNGWFSVNGRRYYADSDGVLKTGWFHYEGKEYFLNAKGAVQPIFRWPLDVKWNTISSYFGYRGEMSVGSSYHDGIDIPADMNTPIYAAKAGTVILQDYSDSAGSYIEISHHNGFVTEYMHMTRFQPEIHPGSKVKKGQVIGYVGSTGWSTGPHLHFGVRLHGADQDPLDFVCQP